VKDKVNLNTYLSSTLIYSSWSGSPQICSHSCEIFPIFSPSNSHNNKCYQSCWWTAWANTVWPCIESLSDVDFR